MSATEKRFLPATSISDGTQTIVFDALSSEAVSHKAKVTSHPVEQGIDITDNIDQLPTELALSVDVTNTPLANQADEPDRANAIFRRLVQVKETGQLVTIITGMAVYSDYGIEEVSTSRDGKTGQALVIDISAKQVRIVGQELVTIPPEILAPKGKRTGVSKADKGRQEGTDFDARETAGTEQYGTQGRNVTAGVDSGQVAQ